MRKLRVVESYRAMATSEASPFAHRVVRLLEASEYVTDGAARVASLKVALAAYDAAVALAAFPTPLQTLERRQLRAAVFGELNRLAKGLNLDFAGDEPALLSTGLPTVAGTGSHSRPAPELGPPTAVKLVDGGRPGCLLLRFKRPAGAVQTFIRYTTEADLPPEQWSVALGGGRLRELGPFASGARVWAKVAALSATTHTPVFSAVVSRMVQ